MKIIKQVWGWSNDTYLIKLDDLLEFENGKTSYVLFNYPEDFDLIAYKSMLYAATDNGDLLDLGSPKDLEKFRSCCAAVRDFFIGE